MQKKKRTVNLTKQVEQSFRDLEERLPDNSVTQELVIDDDASTLEMEPIDLREECDLHDEYDWLAAPLDDWQRRAMKKDADGIDWFGEGIELDEDWGEE